MYTSVRVPHTRPRDCNQVTPKLQWSVLQCHNSHGALSSKVKQDQPLCLLVERFSHSYNIIPGLTPTRKPAAPAFSLPLQDEKIGPYFGQNVLLIFYFCKLVVIRSADDKGRNVSALPELPTPPWPLLFTVLKNGTIIQYFYSEAAYGVIPDEKFPFQMRGVFPPV